MTSNIYAVRDELISFMSPFAERNDDAAIRGFKQACSDPNLLYASQSSDFTLYKVAEFDFDTGVMTPISPILMICRGDDFVQK